MKNKLKIMSLAGFVILAIIVVALLQTPAQIAVGSVQLANEYQATTTSATINTLTSGTATLKDGVGALGSVIITGAGAGFYIYDATTTNVNLRASTFSTSSLPILASFPNTPTVGTYTFDSIVRYGILVVTGGQTTNIGTTTITFR